jgi:hypothetical protein
MQERRGAPVPSVLYATILTGAVEVLGVWVSSMTIFSGAAATWALLSNKPGDEVARQAAYGLAVGFILGIPLTIAAAIATILGG